MDTPVFNFHDLVLLNTAAISLIFVVLRFVVSGKEIFSGLFLSVFFVCIALVSSSTMLLWNEYIELNRFGQSFLPYILALAAAIKGPALLFYVRSLTQSPLDLNIRHSLHTLPAIVICLYILIVDIDTQDLLFASPDFSARLSNLVNFYWYFIRVVPVAYGLFAVVSIYRYKSRLKEQYSVITSLAPNWLNVLSIGFTCAWFWTLAASAVGHVSELPLAATLGILDNYVSFLLVVSLFIYSMSYAQHLLLTKKMDVEEAKPKVQAINPLSIAKVEKGVGEQALHLKANINIEQFSESIDLALRETSAVINQHFGTNFFEFINRRRVDEAKQRLQNPNMSHLTITEIYLECGFNSSSAFQRFFKRFTGTTPSAFRKASMQVTTD